METVLRELLGNLNGSLKIYEITASLSETDAEKQCVLDNKDAIIKYIFQYDQNEALKKLRGHLSKTITTNYSNSANTIINRINTNTCLPKSGNLTNKKLDEIVTKFVKILKVDREWQQDVLKPTKTQMKDHNGFIADYSELERHYTTKSTSFLSSQNCVNETGDSLDRKKEAATVDKNDAKHCQMCYSNNLQKNINEWILMTSETANLNHHLTKLLKILTETLRDYESLKSSYENVCNKCKGKMMKYRQMEYEAGTIFNKEIQRYCEMQTTLTAQKEKENELLRKQRKLTEKDVNLKVTNCGLQVHYQKFEAERENIFKQVEELLKIDAASLEVEEVTKLVDIQCRELEIHLVDLCAENQHI